jgi:hypothetical protein
VEVWAVVEGLQRFLIHSSAYVRLFYSLDGEPEQILQAQLPEEAVDSGIQVGDRVRLTMVLRTVMEVRKVDQPV